MGLSGSELAIVGVGLLVFAAWIGGLLALSWWGFWVAGRHGGGWWRLGGVLPLGSLLAQGLGAAANIGLLARAFGTIGTVDAQEKALHLSRQIEAASMVSLGTGALALVLTGSATVICILGSVMKPDESRHP